MMPSLGSASDPLLFRQKWAKPLTPRLATSDGTDAALGARTNSPGSNKARVTIRASDPGASQQASDKGKREKGWGHSSFHGMRGKQVPMTQLIYFPRRHSNIFYWESILFLRVLILGRWKASQKVHELFYLSDGWRCRDSSQQNRTFLGFPGLVAWPSSAAEFGEKARIV